MIDLSLQILNWYNQNKRDLPWRDTSDPYKIWISEVILQQTRVEQGLSYYLRFVQRWPDVEQLATASEQEVLKMWQGLGYYSRARNLLAAAKQVLHDYNGVFPKTVAELQKLKGIGEYTAAAIASIAFEKPVPVIDGNVYRVISRIFDVENPIDTPQGKKHFKALADSLLDKKCPGNFNQALMEFGALQCIPKSPDCEICPLQSICLAFERKKVDQLPVKVNKIKVRKRFLNYFVLIGQLESQCFTFLRHRKAGDVWQGLYDFPCIETSEKKELHELENEAFFQNIKAIAQEVKPLPGLRKHVLTHQQLMVSFYVVKCKSGFEVLKNNSLSLVSQTELVNYPMPRLIDRFLQDNESLFDNCNKN